MAEPQKRHNAEAALEILRRRLKSNPRNAVELSWKFIRKSLNRPQREDS
ncbi:MAG: hypothetical protein J7545_15580 [Roseofilum sp. SBFL]|nr:hypothetical protein [Roseofilum sp. SBFL]MBP0043368.1 hypothetical protein [Roseofilum sp. SBFL]